MQKLGRLVSPVVSGFIYFALAAAAVATTRFGGGVAFIWIATAYLTAILKLSPRSSWSPVVVCCAIGSFAATSLFGMGFAAAGPLALINMTEALGGAVLLRRLSRDARPLETLGGALLFIFAVGVAAPLATAPFGAMIATSFTGADPVQNAVRWYAGHALGSLAFMPLFVFILSGDGRKWLRNVTPVAATEAAVILCGVCATSFVVFGQQTLPLLFLPTLPLIVALFRIGVLGGACSILAVTIIGGYQTLSGSGPITLVSSSPGDQLQFFQFYIAVLVLIALPMAAELTQRAALTARLRESEARFRLLSEQSSDVVLSLDAKGIIRFASKSAEALGGYLPDQLVGRKASEFVFVEDRERVLDAHRAAFAAPGSVQLVEYRTLTADGRPIWVEASAQALVEAGEPVGMISALRDVEQRRRREGELARQASTDPLTGLLNRRGLFSGVDLHLRSPAPQRSCFAVLDLDHFKQINDEHGHLFGDRVLEEFAEIIGDVVRDADLVGRIGGEEFAILLKGAGVEQAVAVCDRLRDRFAASRMIAPGGRQVRLSVSAGVVPVEAGASRELIYRAADAALYRAKAAGRNQVALAA